MIATQLAQSPGLPMGLDTLGRDLKLQALSKADNGRNDRFIIGVLLKILHEAPVDLDMIHGKLLQMSQGGISGSEIVQCDLDPLPPELSKSRGYVVRVPTKKNGFRDLHLENFGRHPQPVKRPQQVVDDGRLAEFGRREVQSDSAE